MSNHIPEAEPSNNPMSESPEPESFSHISNEVPAPTPANLIEEVRARLQMALQTFDAKRQAMDGAVRSITDRVTHEESLASGPYEANDFGRVERVGPAEELIVTAGLIELIATASSQLETLANIANFRATVRRAIAGPNPISHDQNKIYQQIDTQTEPLKYYATEEDIPTDQDSPRSTDGQEKAVVVDLTEGYSDSDAEMDLEEDRQVAPANPGDFKVPRLKCPGVNDGDREMGRENESYMHAPIYLKRKGITHRIEFSFTPMPAKAFKWPCGAADGLAGPMSPDDEKRP